MDASDGAPPRNPAFTRFSLGVAMRRGWFLYKRQPLLFLSLSAVGAIPHLLEASVGEERETAGQILSFTYAFIHPLIVTGGAAYAVAELRRGGRPTFAGTIDAVILRSLSLLPICLISVSLHMGMFWSYQGLPFAVRAAGILLSSLIALRLSFVTHACMLEKLGPWASLKRSWRITAGQFWNVLGLVLVQFLAAIPILVVIMVFGFFLAAAGQSVDAINVFVALLIPFPDSLMAPCIVAAYLDLRQEKEGAAACEMRQVFD